MCWGFLVTPTQFSCIHWISPSIPKWNSTNSAGNVKEWPWKGNQPSISYFSPSENYMVTPNAHISKCNRVCCISNWWTTSWMARWIKRWTGHYSSTTRSFKTPNICLLVHRNNTLAVCFCPGHSGVVVFSFSTSWLQFERFWFLKQTSYRPRYLSTWSLQYGHQEEKLKFTAES